MIASYVVIGVAALGLLFLIFFFGVCLWERQFLTGDVEPASEPYPYQPTPYWQITRKLGMDLGLQLAGDYATRKNTSLVRGLQTILLTPDRIAMVSVISGASKIGKLKKTIIRSELVGGRVVESTDQPGSATDFSGVVERKVLLNAGIGELLDFHKKRLARGNAAVLPFPPDNALTSWERLDLERGARWVLLGYARWADPNQTTIRLTTKGAFAHIRGMFTEVGKLDGMQERSRIPRAGSHLKKVP